MRKRDGERPALDSRYFVSREKLVEVFADAPLIDFEQFRKDLDACMDPTLRDWWDS